MNILDRLEMGVYVDDDEIEDELGVGPGDVEEIYGVRLHKSYEMSSIEENEEENPEESFLEYVLQYCRTQLYRYPTAKSILLTRTLWQELSENAPSLLKKKEEDDALPALSSELIEGDPDDIPF